MKTKKFQPGDRVYDTDLGYESESMRATILESEIGGDVRLRFDAGVWSDAKGTKWSVYDLRHIPGHVPVPEPKRYRVQMIDSSDLIFPGGSAEELAEMLCNGSWTLTHTLTEQTFKVAPL